MGSYVDRYTPSEPFPRLVVAVLAATVPLVLFVFGAAMVVNMPSPTIAMRELPGLALAVLFVAMLGGSHAGHVLARDVAARATVRDDQPATDLASAGDAASVPDADDPVEVLRRRYAAGELDDEEFERRMARLLSLDPESASPDRESAERIRE